MKKIIAVLIITVSSLSLFAQSEKYIGAMKSNIAAFDTSGGNADLLPALSNTFERIAVAEKNQWLPYYYAAFAQVTFGFLNQGANKFTVFVFSITNVLGSNNIYGYSYSYNGKNRQPVLPPSKRFYYLGCFLSFGIDRTQDAINNNL